MEISITGCSHDVHLHSNETRRCYFIEIDPCFTESFSSSGQKADRTLYTELPGQQQLLKVYPTLRTRAPKCSLEEVSCISPSVCLGCLHRRIKSPGGPFRSGTQVTVRLASALQRPRYALASNVKKKKLNVTLCSFVLIFFFSSKDEN